MVAPAIIGGAIAAGGSIAGGLLGGKSKAPTIDFAPLIAERRRGATKARELIAGIRPQVAPLDAEYQRRISQIGEAGAENRRTLAQNFLGDLGRGVEAAGLQRANLLRQQIAEAQPEQNRQLLEAGAATGGVRRGAVNRAIQGNVQQNQAALNQLTSALDIGSQEAVNNAVGQIFQTEVGAQLRQQGVDEETARYLAETGRGDIIRELAGGAELESGVSTDIINLLQGQQESNVAASLARAQQQNDLIRSIIGGVSTIGGAIAGRQK